MFYRITRFLVRIYLRRIPMHVEGLEHIPARGSAVIAGNHPCAVDHLLLMIALPRPYCGLQRAENFRNAMLAWWLHRTRVFPVTESGDNTRSFRLIQEEMKRGSLYLTAPEGDVSIDGAVGQFHSGFVSLAARSGAPIIPVAVFGTQHVLREPRRPCTWRDFVPRSAPTRLLFLPAIHLQPGLSKEEIRGCSERIRQAIIRRLEDCQAR